MTQPSNQNEHIPSCTALCLRCALPALRSTCSGSEKEVKRVKTLFHLFGLVPEDTIAPLEVLLVMFEAVSGTKTTVLHIRKCVCAR